MKILWPVSIVAACFLAAPIEGQPAGSNGRAGRGRKVCSGPYATAKLPTSGLLLPEERTQTAAMPMATPCSWK